ncbi:MAG TPA: acylphosphatase, partial [Desulfarculaceae bacterium]|nr:acylphosphatase [Desulfarculaceae bacterium]
MEKRLHIIVSGRVQGVWFRASTRDKALTLGLAGQVWN